MAQHKMVRMVHPDLKDQPIDVFEMSVEHHKRAGWRVDKEHQAKLEAAEKKQRDADAATERRRAEHDDEKTPAKQPVK